MTAFNRCHAIVCRYTLLENPEHSQKRENRNRSAFKRAHSRLQFWVGRLRCLGAAAGADVNYKPLASSTPRNSLTSLIPLVLRLPASSRRPPSHVDFHGPSTHRSDAGGGADAGQSCRAGLFECECPVAGCKYFTVDGRSANFSVTGYVEMVRSVTGGWRACGGWDAIPKPVSKALPAASTSTFSGLISFRICPTEQAGALVPPFGTRVLRCSGPAFDFFSPEAKRPGACARPTIQKLVAGDRNVHKIPRIPYRFELQRASIA